MAHISISKRKIQSLIFDKFQDTLLKLLTFVPELLILP